MAQVTIYLDTETAKRVEQAAAGRGASVSSWVRQQLDQAIHRNWPVGYFELFGSLAGSDFERPGQPGFETEGSRESL